MVKTDTSLVSGPAYMLIASLYVVGCLHLIYQACIAAYKIRLYAIEEYGRVIHEFDPYFNYRAAEYLWEHGTQKFFKWFDYMSWYPLGRPVGTTIYPGMQFTSVWIKQFILPAWSINDICCFVPAWFGFLATLATAALCYTTVSSVARKSESKSILMDIPVVNFFTKVLLVPMVNILVPLLKRYTGSTWGIATLKNPPALESAVFTAFIMSIVPAHLLRSVAGGYDNESVATFAMEMTFWTWTLALSANSLLQAVIIGVVSGICYFYMVAAWGGYVFVINLIGVHAVFLFLFRKLPWDHLYASYTSFYFCGTLLAMQIPVVNWQPVKSLEQMGPLLVFAGFQILQLMLVLEGRYKKINKWKVRAGVTAACMILAAPILYFLYNSGYFGPISSRVRGLFVKHTKTGNPLVDSVAEHQAASPEAYYQYLHDASLIAPYGLLIVALLGCTASSSFLMMYGVTAYFFSHKMVRLILLTAPIASICAGIALGYAWAWGIGAIFGDARPNLAFFLDDDDEEEEIGRPSDPSATTPKKKKKGRSTGDQSDPATEPKPSSGEPSKPDKGDALWTRLVRLGLLGLAIQKIRPNVDAFKQMAEQMARAISHPTIIQKGRTANGQTVVVDDYREAYWWLRDNTPEDARIMAWWDYGYQITGIGNRTTIADGNTWNHEHIALLGRTLTSPEKEAHRIARHLADFVLIWAGGGGDDLAKSPHLRRIANSVYQGLCKEPTCRGFGMMGGGQPTKALADSLLYKLHGNGIVPGVQADRNRFREVFHTKHGKVRIYKIMSVSKESKEWVLNNRRCDAPGSWYCPGHYPPALENILAEKRDFAQYEDFNRKDLDKDSQKQYAEQYFENLNKKNARAYDEGSAKGSQDKDESSPNKDGTNEMRVKMLSADVIDEINENWEDTEETSMMWELISNGKIREFVGIVQGAPELVHVRSSDGRGPMWWAYEYKRPQMIEIMKNLGVSDERADKNGLRPIDLGR